MKYKIKMGLYYVKCWIKTLIYIILPYRHLNSNKGEDKRIVVSLTTYPKRFKGVVLTIKSIMWNTLRPDKIVLTLCKSECEDLPAYIAKLLKYGVEIIWAEENLKPHNKYFYVMKRYPEDVIITIDDDILYPRRMIRRLLRKYEQFPNCVICSKCAKIMIEKDKLVEMCYWPIDYTKCSKPSNSLWAWGVGGILYPPNSFSEEVFNKTVIDRYALTNDDVWLTIMEKINNTQVVYAKGANDNVTINMLSNSEEALAFINSNETVYECFCELIQYYNIDVQSFK